MPWTYGYDISSTAGTERDSRKRIYFYVKVDPRVILRRCENGC